MRASNAIGNPDIGIRVSVQQNWMKNAKMSRAIYRFDLFMKVLTINSYGANGADRHTKGLSANGADRHRT